MAVAKVFSTPESVALSQALGTRGYPELLTATGLAYDTDALYLPGSYDCGASIRNLSPARPCLADYTPQASVDVDAGTVGLLYDAEELVDEFSVFLVSEPLTAEFFAFAEQEYYATSTSAGVGVVSDIADFTCGASASGWDYGSAATLGLDLSFDDGLVAPDPAGGTVAGTVFARATGDGVRIELLPGARFVSLRSEVIDVGSEIRGVSVWVETVVGVAPVTMDSAVTTDRYTGPQSTTFTAGPTAVCPGFEGTDDNASTYMVLTGTWRVTTPDGEQTTVDAVAPIASDLYSVVNG
jgi:hypothetical protein